MDLPTLRDGGLVLRSLADAELDALVALLDVPGVHEWWVPSPDPQDDLRCEGHAFAIEVDNELAGWLGFAEELDPDYMHASMDILLAPRFQGAGVGPAALRLLARWFFEERGHHRITIDPNCRNERAIRAYESVGFRRVGVMRRYERGRGGEWEDGLLMDLLAQELR
jgi:aminoglycoside 6'-N-acetyltransferase